MLTFSSLPRCCTEVMFWLVLRHFLWFFNCLNVIYFMLLFVYYLVLCHIFHAILFILLFSLMLLLTCGCSWPVEDLERNDGSAEKPYFMNQDLMKTLNKSNSAVKPAWSTQWGGNMSPTPYLVSYNPAMSQCHSPHVPSPECSAAGNQLINKGTSQSVEYILAEFDHWYDTVLGALQV